MNTVDIVLAQTPPGRVPTRSRLDIAHAEAELNRSRQQVARSVMALRRHIAKRMDWRQWVRDRPVHFAIAAFAVGLFIGLEHRTILRHR